MQYHAYRVTQNFGYTFSGFTEIAPAPTNAVQELQNFDVFKIKICLKIFVKQVFQFF